MYGVLQSHLIERDMCGQAFSETSSQTSLENAQGPYFGIISLTNCGVGRFVESQGPFGAHNGKLLKMGSDVVGFLNIRCDVSCVRRI